MQRQKERATSDAPTAVGPEEIASSANASLACQLSLTSSTSVAPATSESSPSKLSHANLLNA